MLILTVILMKGNNSGLLLDRSEYFKLSVYEDIFRIINNGKNVPTLT